jgi:hypothetical protein
MFSSCSLLDGPLDLRAAGGTDRLVLIEEEHPVAAEASLEEGPVALHGERERPVLAMFDDPKTMGQGSLGAAIGAAGINQQALIAPGEGVEAARQVAGCVEAEDNGRNAGRGGFQGR